MKMRLAIFVSALLLLPLAGFLLSGHEWIELGVATLPPVGNTTALAITMFMLLGYVLFINLLVKWRTGNSPFSMQRNYFLVMGGVSAALGGLIFYFNLFVSSWPAEQGLSLLQTMFCIIGSALLAPSILGTRALFGSFAGLLRFLARGPALSAPPAETSSFILIPLALAGLMGGPVWSEQLFWLLWAAPLLLLVALQLLWHESTIFFGLKSGDWGRIVCAALSGLIVGNLVAMSYQAAGGDIEVKPLGFWLMQSGYVLFGLLCLQLGDVIAEQWRGKQRRNLFRQKKFPIPVVVKKD